MFGDKGGNYIYYINKWFADKRGNYISKCLETREVITLANVWRQGR